MKRFSPVPVFVTGLSCVLFVACSDSPKDSGAAVLPSRSLELSGSYSDTLPCADCDGIVTDLLLHPDSTFMLRERRLGGNADKGKGVMGKVGRYQPEEGWQKLRLMIRNEPANRWISVDASGGMLVLDSAGNAQQGGDFLLDRMDKVTAQVGKNYVRHSIVPHQGPVARVFQRTGRGDITINKPYLDGAPEAEKAIVAAYALQLDAGCDSAMCALSQALGMDENTQRGLVQRYLGAVPEMAPALQSMPPAMRNTMTSLVIIQRDGLYSTTVTYLDGADNVRRITDDLRLDGDHFVLVRRTEGNAQRQVIDRNPDRPEEFPQGGKQVIDLRKMKEKEAVKK